MAKRETGIVGAADVAAVAAPAPASSPPAPGSGNSAPAAKETVGKVGAMAPTPDAPLVIKYKPPADEPTPSEELAAEGEAPAEEAAAPVEGEEAPAEEQAAETDEAAAEEKPTEPAKPPKARAILERIRAEKAKLRAEEVAAQERTQRQQLEQQLSRYTSGTIGARLAAIGITTDEQRMQLAEALLIGKDDVALPAEAAAPSTDQRVAELEKRLAAEEQAKQQAQAQQTYQQMHGAILTMTSDMDLGVVKAVEKLVGARHADGSPAGTHLITAVARQMWEEAGRPQNSLPIVRKAAERVLEHYRTAYPEVFANQTAATTATPAAKRPAMGQRVAPKPGANGRKLPLDREDRDEAIKREFGW